MEVELHVSQAWNYCTASVIRFSIERSPHELTLGGGRVISNIRIICV